MDIRELVEIVENMAVQHAYPGFDVRSLKLGLPDSVTKGGARLFVSALHQPNPLVRLAALRWFWDRPGDAKRHVQDICALLEDADEWVRLEAVRDIGRIDIRDESVALRVAKTLEDPSVEVRKAASKTCGKLACKADPIIMALQKAAEDSDTEVRWKAQKALRQLGAYVA